MTRDEQLIPLATVLFNPGTNRLHLTISDNVTEKVDFCLSAIHLLAQAAEQARQKKATSKIMKAPPGMRIQ